MVRNRNAGGVYAPPPFCWRVRGTEQMMRLLQGLEQMNSALWGGPLLLLLLGTHLFFTVRLRFVQRKIGTAIRLSVQGGDGEGNAGSFQTLAATLAATLGTGNIVGVSTAVAYGGAGAVFWCWLTGVFGMATTYAECYLGVKYRKRMADGSFCGGPMYAMEYGLHSKTLARVYCVCALLVAFGMGCSTQSHTLADTVISGVARARSVPAPAENLLADCALGILTAVLVGLVIIGGMRAIHLVCEKLVPAMAVFYCVACGVILVRNSAYIVPALKLIFQAAFSLRAVGGGVLGGGILLAARYGIARGLFTNEAGLGSAALAAADGKTARPEEQALVSMSATFWDTVVMCAITGLVIVSALLRTPEAAASYGAAELTTAAFALIPYVGPYLLDFALVAFAIATLIGWAYLAQKTAVYLFGKKGVPFFQVTYLLMIFLGAVLSLDMVWALADFVNALLVIPNLILLFLLCREVKAE